MLLAAAAAALGVSSATAASRKASTALDFERVLQREDVAVDAYENVIYAPAPTLAQERSDILKLRDAVARANHGLGALRVRPRLRPATRAFTAAGRRLIVALERVSRGPDSTAIMTGLDGAVSPALASYFAAERSLRRRVGLAVVDRWFGAVPRAAAVYADSLAKPGRRVRWRTGRNAFYAYGGLGIYAAADTTQVVRPSTHYRFDAQHIAIEADATVGLGDPYYGLACPPVAGAPGTFLVGQIGPGTSWSFAVVGPGAYLIPEGSTRSVHPHRSNHLRLDCDQWGPGLTTARLYVNGHYLGAASAPLSLSRRGEPGLVVASNGAPAGVLFKRWLVSRLGR